MYLRRGSVLFIAVVILTACARRPVSQVATATPQLKYLHTYVIPHNLEYEHTLVGGLSGIDYDQKNDRYFMISDERSATSPARFYTAKITIGDQRIKSVDFTSVVTLKQPGGAVFPSMKENANKAPDPESIRFNPLRSSLTWSSEGDKSVRNGRLVLQDPFIYEMNLSGNFKDSFFIPSNMRMQPGEAGPRTNGVFEGLTFDGKYRYLYASVEEPIFDDGPRADVGYSCAPVRIIKFDAATRKPIAQYAYKLDGVAHPPTTPDAFRVNGVPEILWLSQDKLLVLERSFSTGILTCTIKIFLADLSKATDVSAMKSLSPNTSYTPVEKKLLLNFDQLGGFVDNVEGICFGPILPNGRQSLILVADNNFQAIEQSQVYLFEIVY